MTTRLKIAAAYAVAKEKIESQRFATKEIKNLAESYVVVIEGMRESKEIMEFLLRQDSGMLVGIENHAPSNAAKWLSRWKDLL